jgi:hypothetical protein
LPVPPTPRTETRRARHPGVAPVRPAAPAAHERVSLGGQTWAASDANGGKSARKSVATTAATAPDRASPSANARPSRAG